jgi:tRNA U38,U39,U40 pseudouridine synthase TruA
MVRSLTSTLVAVGKGEMSADDVTMRLREPDKLGLPAPAPAAGLSLIGVNYP